MNNAQLEQIGIGMISVGLAGKIFYGEFSINDLMVTICGMIIIGIILILITDEQ